jgi:hypothetical protein
MGVLLFCLKGCNSIEWEERGIFGTYYRQTGPALAEGALLWAAVGFGVALIWPVIGAFAVFICSGLRSWATQNQSEPWNRSEEIAPAAVWPLASYSV